MSDMITSPPGSAGIRLGSRPPSAPNSGNKETPNNSHGTGGAAVGAAGGATPPSKAAVQMQKMRDANTKYKNLLKMAKERIEQQDEELKKLRGAWRMCLLRDLEP
jgi:hypothetical protein